MQRNAMIALTVLTVGILVAAGVGVGLAYQATFTDQTSAQSTATGQYLKIVNGTDSQTIVDAIPLVSTTYYLNAGIDINNSNGSPIYKWDLTDANLTSDSAGKTAIKVSEVSEKAEDQDTATVKALFYIGAYNITSPQTINDATVKIEKTIGGTAQKEGVTFDTKVILTDTAYTTAPEISSLAENKKLEDQTLGTEAADYFVYILAEWTVPSPTEDTGSSVESQLILPTVSIKMTVTADDFAPTPTP